MKKIFILISIVISSPVFAQNSETLDNCSQTLVAVEKSLNALDEKQTSTLLSSVNSGCLSSMEFSEWVNELIYTVAIKYPDYFIKSFSKQPKKTQSNILTALESPIHDGIDLKKAHKAINSATGGTEKARILSAIEVGAKKIGLSF
ncbi:MAG: hypothetical protein OEV42_03395 [Deltaproteobacteria bacterium]|nr:hypothetical protein [Deltaproteobacteria bacterium]